MSGKVCPIWVGYLLSSPLRRLIQNPNTILSPFIKPGMTVADIGCAMGFFSIPMGHMVGEKGKVICLDIQEGMLKQLKKKARAKNMDHRMEYRPCHGNSFPLGKGEADFICAFAVVHEIPDPTLFFTTAARALKAQGNLLFCEPAGHVSTAGFEKELAQARACGFEVVDRPRIKKSHGAVLKLADSK